MKGVKISKQRRNVNQATANELVLDSTTLGSFKIHNNITITIISTWVVGTQQTITIAHPHGLDYVPAYSAVVNHSDTGVSQQIPYFNVSVGGTEALDVYVDNQNVYARVQAKTSRTYIFHIVVFSERLDISP